MVKSKAWNQRFTSLIQIYTRTYIQSQTYFSTRIYTQNAQTYTHRCTIAHTNLYNSTYNSLLALCLSMVIMQIYICNTHILSNWVVWCKKDISFMTGCEYFAKKIPCTRNIYGGVIILLYTLKNCHSICFNKTMTGQQIGMRQREHV